MSEDRRLDVLRAIVEDYVATKEPVGSRALVERHSLGVSPATIRNDMAALEEGGYIAQPHTSAGRVPTDKGYRLFVDQLSTVKPLSSPERRAIGTFLENAQDLDDVVDRAVRLIAQLTQQVAVVQYPSLRRSALRHVELVPGRRAAPARRAHHGHGPRRAAHARAGRGPRRVRRRPAARPPERQRRRSAALRAARRAGRADARRFAPADQALVNAVVAVVEETLAQESEERVVLAGTANLARVGSSDVRSIGPVLEALEEQVVLLRLLSEMAEDHAAVAVRIGRETQHDGLVETSFVTTGYGDEGGGSVARIGSIGPLRMDYPGTMSAVRAVARYLTRILAQ